MNPRLPAFLLALCMALQSLVPGLVYAAAEPVAEHCASSESPEHSTHDVAQTQAPSPCSHCDHAGASHAGCANQCLFALALLPAMADIAVPSGTLQFAGVTLPPLTRFDIPPTPPPIA